MSTDRTEASQQPEDSGAVGSQVDRGVRPDSEALKREQAMLRSLTYKTDAITARLEAIHGMLERAAWTQ